MGAILTVLVNEVEEKVIQDLDALSKQLQDLHQEFNVATTPLDAQGGWTGTAANAFWWNRLGQDILLPLDGYVAELTMLGVTLRMALEEIKQADELALKKAGELDEAINAVNDFENL